jgi:hypothetical protein
MTVNAIFFCHHNLIDSGLFNFYGIFNVTLCSSDYIVLNDRMIGE